MAAESSAGVNGTHVRAREYREGADEWPWPMAGSVSMRVRGPSSVLSAESARRECRHCVHGHLVVGYAAPPSVAVRSFVHFPLVCRCLVDTPTVTSRVRCTRMWLKLLRLVLPVPLSVIEVSIVVVKFDRRKDRVAIGIVTTSLDDVLLRTFASRYFLTPRWHVVYVPPHYFNIIMINIRRSSVSSLDGPFHHCINTINT